MSWMHPVNARTIGIANRFNRGRAWRSSNKFGPCKNITSGRVSSKGSRKNKFMFLVVSEAGAIKCVAGLAAVEGHFPEETKS